MIDDEATLIRLSEVEKRLGVCRWTLYQWLKEGRLSGLKLPSGQFRVAEDEVRRIREEMASRWHGSARGHG